MINVIHKFERNCPNTEVEREVKAVLNGGGGEVDDLIERLAREQLHPNHYFIFCLKEHLLYARYKVGLITSHKVV